MRQNSSFLLLFLLLLNTACDSNRIFDSYIAVADQNWETNQKISFPFVVKDTLTTNALFVTIRNNNEYAFRNLLLIVGLDYPNGKKIVDTLVCKMADEKGTFLGKGLTEIKENKFLYKKSFIFPTSGNYKLTVAQAMYKNGETYSNTGLEGITDVGFRIEKGN